LIGRVKAISWGPGRIDLFGVSLSESKFLDAKVVTKFLNGNEWSDWDFIGGRTYLNSVEAISWGPGRLDVFWGGGSTLLLKYLYRLKC
jgi:hypothetical protein